MHARKSNSMPCSCGKATSCSGGCSKKTYRAGGMLTGGQKRLDKNENGKLDANDFEMLRKYMSGGMLKEYMAGGMIKKYAAGGPVEGGPKEEALATIASMIAADNASQESGSMPSQGSEKSTDVVMPGLAAALRAIGNYEGERPGGGQKDIEPIQPPPPIEPPPTVVKKEIPRPTLGGGEEESEERKVDFGGSRGKIEFSPMFGGNISQTGFRGPGTTGALTGAWADIKNPDGTMDRVKTRLSDLPDSITKDPYFSRLVDTANKRYFNMERARGSIGGAEATKTPEAKLIARILNGDITLEQAKREANFQQAPAF
tara:strand:+ start:3186 stop:4130 length:945 start_codon:yes stop_codon:yes gene_type:complete